MKHSLTKQTLLDLVKGASLLTTGGGVPVADQLKTVKKLNNPKLTLVNPDSVDQEGYIITAAEIGPSDAPQIKKDIVAKKMLDLLEKITGRNIVGIYPPEIGQESVVIESSLYLNLPIIDFDPVGFRAVPYIDINVFNITKIPYSFVPLVACNDQEDIFSVNGNFTYEKVEKTLREMTSLSTYNTLFLLGGLMQAKVITKNKLTTGSYSKALELGKVSSNKELLKKLNPLQVFSGVVTDKVESEKKGFFSERVTILSNNKNYQLVILNEVMFMLDENENIIAEVPQRILLTDEKQLIGIPSSELKKGKSVQIIICNEEKEWKSNKIFNKKRFSELLK